MLTKTKWMIAGLATLALLGTAVVAAADGAASTSATADMTKSYQGKHLSFGYDGSTGSLSDYRADGVTLFDSISIGEWNASALKAREHGRMVGFRDGDLARGVAFDAKNAAFVIASPAGNTLTLVVPDGVTIEQHQADPGWSPAGVLLRYADNETARLAVHGGNVTVSGQTITIVLSAHGRADFRVEGHPYEAAKERLALLKLQKHLKEKRHDKASVKAGASASADA